MSDKSIYANEIKTATRTVVLNQYRKWAKDIFKRKQDITAYTLPADIWDFEQTIAFDMAGIKGSKLDLTCFERNRKVYKRNKNSRHFMLNGCEYYHNLTFEYKNELMHPNLRAKKNFFMWADFCGLPKSLEMDMLLNERNLVDNSLIFVTFAARWRNCKTIDPILHAVREDRFENDLNPRACKAHHSSDAIEGHIYDTMCDFGFFPIVNIQYIASKGSGATPMCLVGFSNSKVFKQNSTLRQTINWFRDGESKEARKELNYRSIKACTQW